MLTRGARARRQRQDLVSERDVPAEKKQLYEENAALSPLLALPAEIRNRIYVYVLGAGSVIHIQVRPCSMDDPRGFPPNSFYGSYFQDLRKHYYFRVAHTLCYEQGDIEAAAYKASRDGLIIEPKSDYETMLVDAYYYRHKKCADALPDNVGLRYGSMSPEDYDLLVDRKPHPGATGILDTSLLKTCRQINQEAALIPFACNTFAFNDGNALNFFVTHVLRGRQRGAISSLYLDGQMNSYGVYNPRRPKVRAATVDFLKGLRRLHVCLPMFLRGERMEGIAEFARLPLEEVHVIMDEKRGISEEERRHEADCWEQLLLTGDTSGLLSISVS